ncbi:MAG: tetratricopeptide repeat protein [Bacteroidota bacterium]|nr:tetratricopeptide repeat protein [Bacteroidota bacterium]
MKVIFKHRKLFLLMLILISLSCSTEKNKWLNRTYHNITAHYNVYFNGREAYRKGIQRIEDQMDFDFTRRLPIYLLGNEETATTAISEMDKAIKKASKTIKKHSIKVKPKRKEGRLTEDEQEFMEKNEYNKWVDDSYLLMGKAYFVKNEFLPARQNFEYLLREFPNEPIRYEAMIWLGRTALATNNLQTAKKWIDQIDAEENFPEDLNTEYEILNAAYYLALNNEERAIPHLKKAIEENKDKKQRTRHQYIIAQIYKDQQNYRKAAEHFEIVTKKSSDYKLEFNAKINMAECYGKMGGSYKEMHKLLSKMLKDDKNIEYMDQIYYALAEVEYKNGKTEQAIEHYKLSSEHAVTNTSQKAQSCLRLGDIYYEKPNYRLSQAYYDTCILNLSREHPRFNEINSLSKNLNKLVNNLDVVQAQDSLQRIAGLSKKERNQIIDSLIQVVREEEQRQKELQQQQQQNSMLFDQRRGTSQVNAPSGGKWYFYNPATLSFGANEFQKKWGKRKLEDHWRRSNKAMITDNAMGEDSTASDSTAETNRVTDNKSREYYLQYLPLTDSLMAVSNQNIKEALFNLGDIYYDDFYDYDKSISAFEELDSRFPDHEYKLLSYYNLYELYQKKDKPSKSQSYKEKIINQFPDSRYAKILKNPNYLQDLLDKEKEATEAYENIYTNYKQGGLAKVKQQCQRFYENYPDSELTDKVKFLDIMAGALNIKHIELKRNLASFIQQYPDSKLIPKATSILSYLGESDIDALLADLESRPEVTREQPSDTSDSDVAPSLEEIAEETYDFDPDETHYYIISANTNEINTKQLRFEISNFNIFTFSRATFRVLYYLIDENTELVFVKSFKGKKQSMNYMKLIENNQNVFGELNPEHYTQFVISESNYEKLKKDKDLKKYLTFYGMNYR